MELNTFADSMMVTFASIGVGTPRWIREFKEYRPWKSQEQFTQGDREIRPRKSQGSDASLAVRGDQIPRSLVLGRYR